MSHLPRGAVLLWIIAAALSCAKDKPAPTIVSVSPNRLPQQLSSTITVTGEHYFTEVRGALDSDPPNVDRGFVLEFSNASSSEQTQTPTLADSTTLQAIAPAGLEAGAYDIRVQTPGGREAVLPDAVTVEPVGLTIETSSDGRGLVVPDQEVFAGTEVQLFSVVRFEDGEFFRNEGVQWSVEGPLTDVLSANEGTSTIFQTTNEGTFVIQADHPILEPVSVTISVRRCSSDTECSDLCHTAGACVAGICELGDADKDSDQDGFVDANCEGGDDCDDEPGICGASCFPGNTDSDICDTFDQDCDGEVDEDPELQWFFDADEDGFGDPSKAMTGCDAPPGYVASGSDCDDDPAMCGARCSPGTEESTAAANCSDSVDNDCDTLADSADPQCMQIGGNRPPTISVSVDPIGGRLSTVFTGTASVADLEDAVGDLTVEWDWDEDGVFEQSGTVTTHSYGSIGRKYAVARVTDSGGLSSYGRFDFGVLLGITLVEVTTPLDENDDGANPFDPGGDGLSLREALAYAERVIGDQQILVPPGFTIEIGSPLRVSSGAVQVGGEGARVECGNGNFSGFEIASSNVEIYALTVANCRRGFDVLSGSGTRLFRVTATGNRDHGVRVMNAASDVVVGPDANIFGNGTGLSLSGSTNVEQSRIYDNDADGLLLLAGSETSEVWGNWIYGNGQDGVRLGAGSNIAVRYNTFHDNADDGFQCSNMSTNIDLVGNIFTAHGALALRSPEASYATRTHNVFFSNTGGLCIGCSGLGTSSTQVDPDYVDAANDDLRLNPQSTITNSGPDVGLDLNGSAPGLYSGSAPDIGGWESPY